MARICEVCDRFSCSLWSSAFLLFSIHWLPGRCNARHLIISIAEKWKNSNQILIKHLQKKWNDYRRRRLWPPAPVIVWSHARLFLKAVWKWPGLEKFDVFLYIGYNVFREKDMITKTKYSANMIEKAGMLWKEKLWLLQWQLLWFLRWLRFFPFWRRHRH